jgi:hypothetical protein
MDGFTADAKGGDNGHQHLFGLHRRVGRHARGWTGAIDRAGDAVPNRARAISRADGELAGAPNYQQGAALAIGRNGADFAAQKRRAI